jgi:protein-disulfide isomerase
MIPRAAFAQTPSCDALTGEKKTLTTAIMASQHPYDCCDGTIQQCLTRKPVCQLAVHLANHVCRLAALGKDRATIERSLAQRATSMTGARSVPIDLSRAERAGDPAAKVTVVAYLCARCPYCSRLLPALHRSATEGELKGKVRLYFREFPIRSHAGSTEGSLAMVAARHLGKGWPYLLHLYRIFDKFDGTKLVDYAVEDGLDAARFRALMAEPGVRRELVASKKEGVRNKVSATPTVFINGRPYGSDLDIEVLKTVLLEEHERVTRKK